VRGQLTSDIRTALAERQRFLTEAAGGDPFPVRTPSDREMQIICLVALGLTNAEVAWQLHISHHTVAQHLSDILRECGARSRCELIARAYAAGILVNWPPQRITRDEPEPDSPPSR
jgi:DNA-binding CsgD family transcriptional regulator